jgi:peptidoglycan/xylan/chitin deacetylase (PgdA/CDA1 family)
MLVDHDLKGADLPPPTLCLTYDDGPGPHTRELGRYLHEEGIRAAFFLLGRLAEGQGDLLRQLRAWGHLLGNHTWSHPGLVTLARPGGDVVAEVARADAVLRPHVRGPVLLRPPYGSWRDKTRPGGPEDAPTSVVADRLRRSGQFEDYVGPIKWDIVAEDWECWRQGVPAEECAARHLEAVERVGRGIVLLMFVPYSAIERHGVLGDRRSAALVAADGTLDWLCLPDYDAPPVFAALLDAAKGGHWRLGPVSQSLGSQRYRTDTFTLLTSWDFGEGRLELADGMAWPAKERQPGAEGVRLLVRHLRCKRGQVRCVFDFNPRREFAAVEPAGGPGEASYRVGPHRLRLWASRPIEASAAGARAAFDLREGEEVWAVAELDGSGQEWSARAAREAVADTERYWRRWAERLGYSGPRARQVRRSAMLVHLLSYVDHHRGGGPHDAQPPTQQGEVQVAVLAPGGREALVEAADRLQGAAPAEQVGRHELRPLQARRVQLVIRRPLRQRHYHPARRGRRRGVGVQGG